MTVPKLPSSGRVDKIHLLKVIEESDDGVFVAGYLEGECYFVAGDLKTRRKVQVAKKTG